MTAARELAENEGWDAVTTLRPAAEIEYGQPVLSSHFEGKDAVMAAVAVRGFAELAQELRAARAAVADPGDALAAVGEACTDFGERRPALYDAMFTHMHILDLRFATPEAPPALREAFGEPREVILPLAGDDDPGILAETFWGGLRGLVTLMRSGRLPRAGHDRRLSLLIGHFAPPR